MPSLDLTTADERGGFFAHAAAARQRYVAFLEEAIVDLRARSSVAVELLVRPNGRTTPEPFCLCRLDAVVGSAAAPELKRIADRLPKPEPLHDRLGGKMDVAQDSFSWESLRLRFQSSRFDVALLGPWLHKWLDPGEDRSGDAEGLSGVVHGLSWDRKSSAWDLHIDLGSAPIEALEELMGVIADAGTVSVHVSSGDAADATSP